MISFLLLAAVPLAAISVYVSRQIEQVRGSVNRAATVTNAVAAIKRHG